MVLRPFECCDVAMVAAIILVGHSMLACGAASAGEPGGSRKADPKIEDYATVEADSNGVPVYAFGYTYVYGVSPDLLPGAAPQEGNTHPAVKVKPKKSWEITHNLCGSTPAREPKTMWNDDQPLLPIHLIDGDPETAWSSRGGNAPDTRPEWIRIDLPAESEVAAVALVCSEKGPAGDRGRGSGLKPGKALPGELAVRLSRDARYWETVYENKDFSGPDTGPRVIEFPPQRAKQVWIVGSNLQPVQLWGPSFSISEVEVRDPAGDNLALVSRGAGVTVSSTHYGYGMDRFTQDMLWPIQYDLGFQWTRVGYDMGVFTWQYVEREKGRLQIDARADEAITEAWRNGMKVILCLDKGNWLYHDPPRKVDWKKARTREMMETYFDHPGWPDAGEEMLAGWLRYVDYMVRHFKGRVAYFEICNEWQGMGIDEYIALVRATIPAIKKADPDARIMLGSTGGFDRGAILACLGAGTTIHDGRLQVTGKTIAVRDGVEERDAVVSVDANSDAEAGIVLRLKDGENFLLANYAPQHSAIYFHEVVDGDYGPSLAAVGIEGLGPTIHLVAEVEGSKVTLAVSDGAKRFGTSHTIQRVTEPGAVGLFQNATLRQAFGNFRATDRQGRTLAEDSFSRPEGAASGWTLISGRWEDPENRLGPQLDAVGWHPFYQTDPDDPALGRYRQDVEEFKDDCAALGFAGQYAATEWTWVAPYPGAADWCSEMQKAKYSARLMAAHCGMDVISLYNETFQTGRIDWDVTLLRNAFQVDPISPAQPQPIYYALRTISTVVDDFHPAEFPVSWSAEPELEVYTFRRGENELLVAGWVPGRASDGIAEIKTDLTLPGVRAKRAWAVDAMNGTEQELDITRRGSDTLLGGMLVKDYPVFVRIVQ